MKEIVIILFIILSGLTLWGQTSISGTITNSQTWTPAGSPYLLSGTVVISGTASPVVTIEAGTQIRFNPDAEIVVGHASQSVYKGGMIVNGTSENPVLFTSNSSEPSPGDWKHIKPLNHLVSGTMTFSYAIFEYGGSIDGMIEVSGGAPIFDSCTFRYSQNLAINHPSTSYCAQVTNCAFVSNGSYPLNWYQNKVYKLGAGNVFTDNAIQRILLLSESVSTAQTWLNHGIPYEPEADILVYSGSSPLIIESGNTVIFRSGKKLQIGHPSQSVYTGCLVAQQVLFTGLEPMPGFWVGIVGNNHMGEATTDISDSIIEYAGYLSSTLNTALLLNSNAGINIDGCTIRNSSGWAVYLQNSSAQPVIENCTFMDNFRSVSLPAADVWLLGTGNLYSGAADLRPEVRSGTVASTCYWNKQQYPWYINGNLTISGSSDPVLTIEPYSILEFHSGSKLIIGSTSTSYYCSSIYAENVTFKANDINIWGGIDFYHYSNASTLLNCTIRDFGSGNAPGIKNSSISTITIDGCQLVNGLAYGIEFITGAMGLLTNTFISACDKTISIHANDMAKLGTGNQFIDNNDNRIQCRGGSITSSASWITQSVPVRIATTLTFNTLTGTVLTINYGAILEFATGTAFSVGSTSSSNYRCTLRAYNTIFRGEEQTSGFWNGITLNTYTGNCLFSSCTIQDAGGDGTAGLTNNSSSSAITGSLITNCSAKGLYFGVSSRGSISGTVITACGSNPISLTSNAVTNIGPDNDFTGNGIDRIEVRAETITNSTVWRNAGIPYQPTGTISISGSNYPRFVLLPGVVVMFPNSAGFILGTSSSSSRGSLEANSVTFTRSSPDAIPSGLVYQTYIDEPNCVLTNCTIEYAMNASQDCAVYVNASAPSFNYCTFTNLPGDGIKGISSADFSVNNCTFSNINGYPIKTSALYFAAVSGVGNQFINCNPNRILISGGIFSTNAEWHNPGVPIEVSSNISVYSSSYPILKINSGLVLLFSTGTGISIGTTGSPSLKGGIQATGATFSALSGTQGGWTGIQLNNYALASSFLENCTIQYATSNIYLNNIAINRIKNCIVRYGNYGLRLTGANASFPIIGNHITQCNIGIYTSTNANPIIGGSMTDGNSLTGNTTYGLQNTSANTINATYNWWGDPSGPALRIGDMISGNIDYTPWRETNIGDGPSVFHLLLPQPGEVVPTRTPLLDWEEAVDPSPQDTVRYCLYYSLTQNFSSGVYVTDDLYNTNYRIPSGVLADDSRIWWRVMATDTQDQTTNSFEQGCYFDIAVPEPPAPFALTEPVNLGSVDLTSIRLSWSQALDPDPGDMVSYWVYLGSTAGFEEADSILVSTTYVYSGFCSPGEIFYWKVKAIDLSGNETNSQTFRFFVHPDARPRPPAEITLSPTGEDLVLDWDAVPGADGYQVFHSAEPFGSYQYLGDAIGNCFLHSEGAGDERHFYHIRSIDSAGRISD